MDIQNEFIKYYQDLFKQNKPCADCPFRNDKNNPFIMTKNNAISIYKKDFAQCHLAKSISHCAGLAIMKINNNDLNKTMKKALKYIDFKNLKLDAPVYKNIYEYLNRLDAKCKTSYHIVDEVVGGFTRIELNNKWGFINKNIITIPIVYDELYPFEYGLSLVKVGCKWGFINKYNNFIIPAIYDELYPFKNNLAVCMLGNFYGFINRKNIVIIDFIYEDAYSFKENLAAVKLNGKYGFINKRNKIVINCIFSDVCSFHNGIARVILDDKDGVIDINGKFYQN